MGWNDHVEDFGYGTLDTHVCSDCVVDAALRELVESNLSGFECSYCGITSGDPVAAPLEVVIECVYNSIGKYYADAQNIGIPWDKGWVLSETELWKVVGEFDPGWGWKLLEDITNCIGYDKYFVPHVDGDWGKGNPASALRYGWFRFSETVMYKTRYLFHFEPYDEIDVERGDEIPVRFFLNALGTVASRLNLILKVSVNTQLFRVRVVPNGKIISKFSEISVPPKRIAGAGRMNPAGIPYLYVALDEVTSVKETVTEENREYASAVMTTNKELKVLNLCDLPATPSLFDPDRYQERNEIQFLASFRDDISKPVSKDGMEHVEYVPTQIISEYFRHKFEHDGEKMNGIMFNSSKNDGGRNIALFVSNHEEVEKILSIDSITMKK